MHFSTEMKGTPQSMRGVKEKRVTMKVELTGSQERQFYF